LHEHGVDVRGYLPPSWEGAGRQPADGAVEK
jgi:hypothetical protein